MMWVGAVRKDMLLPSFSQDAGMVNIWAPGAGLWGVSSPWAGDVRDMVVQYQVNDNTGIEEYVDFGPVPFKGTSLAAPLVAGLAAYFRGIAVTDPSSRLAENVRNPEKVIWLITKLQCKVTLV